MAFKKETYVRLMHRIDIVEVIAQCVELKPRSRGQTNEYLGLCPFHQENTPSFSVTRVKQFFHCFGCGKQGNAVNFLQDFCGLSGGKALVKAAEMCGIKIPQGPSNPNPKKLHDRKKYKRKKAHRRAVVRNRENRTYEAANQTQRPASIFTVDPQDCDIPF